MKLLPFSSSRQIGCAVQLAWKRAQLVDARIESQRRAVERFQAEAAGDVGRAAEQPRPPGLHGAERGHHGCAIGQGEPLLGGQRDRRQPCFGKRITTRQHAFLPACLAQADQHERHVGQRR